MPHPKFVVAAVGLAGLPAMPLRAAPVTRKIALEEHFTTPELEQRRREIAG